MGKQVIFLPSETAFQEDPRSEPFFDAALNGSLETPGTAISEKLRKELAARYGLDSGQARALAYLAGHLVEELEMDLLVLGTGDVE